MSHISPDPCYFQRKARGCTIPVGEPSRKAVGIPAHSHVPAGGTQCLEHALTHSHTHTRVDLLLSFWLLDGSGPLTSRTPHPSVQKGGKNEIIIEKEGKKKKKKIKILIQKNVWDFAYARGFA